MLFKIGNIVTDSKQAIKYPHSNWHSDMSIQDLQGKPVPVPRIAKKVIKDIEKRKQNQINISEAVWEGYCKRVKQMPKLRKPPIKPYRRPKHILK